MCIITEITTSLANRTVCVPVSTCGAWALSPWVPDSGPGSLGLGGHWGCLQTSRHWVSFLEMVLPLNRDRMSLWRAHGFTYFYFRSLVTVHLCLPNPPSKAALAFPSENVSWLPPAHWGRGPAPPGLGFRLRVMVLKKRDLHDPWIPDCLAQRQTMAAWTFGKYCCNKKDKAKQPGLSRLLLCNELCWEKGIWSKINSAVIVGTLLPVPIKERIRQTRVSLFKQRVFLLTCSTQLSRTQAINSPENSQDCLCCGSKASLFTRLTKTWARPLKIIQMTE